MAIHDAPAPGTPYHAKVQVHHGSLAVGGIQRQVKGALLKRFSCGSCGLWWIF